MLRTVLGGGLCGYRSFSVTANKLGSQIKLGETFGEAESKMKSKERDSEETENPSQFLAKVTENKTAYNNFYKDFSASVADQGHMTSFEEQKSFHKIFNYLKNEHGKIGITDTIKKISGFTDSTTIQTNQLLGDETFRLASQKSSAIKTRFEEKLKHNRDIMFGLQPTIDYINTKINDGEQLAQFVRHNVLQGFLDNVEALTKHDRDRINKASIVDPSKPLVDKSTLPLLLRFCLTSMTNDFNSLDETLLIINYIKRHQSIELYEFGLNIDVYNALIDQIWTNTENLQLVSRMVDELKVNAIPPDLVTYKLLANIYLKCMNVQDELNAEPYLLWGDSSDIHKVKHFVQDIKIPN
ncbi:hypothetical protein FOA43_001718 [Brettanomyces nanus]|uniref:Mtf2-like C-terminal domain-containing protein n=1 Tax=Eeniella nana TaxID=13502 RepID=A0A875RY18_EENNA|nr:uncharacterized protein FOA43_001718 [Brettanomyces nanus]QPG74391.1 hypothetical protein FOA43_001718 [Brettanomyces nanus]